MIDRFLRTGNHRISCSCVLSGVVTSRLDRRTNGHDFCGAALVSFEVLIAPLSNLPAHMVASIIDLWCCRTQFEVAR